MPGRSIIAIFCAWVACAVLAPARADVITDGAVSVTPGLIDIGMSSGDGTLRITSPSAVIAGQLRVGTPANRAGNLSIEGGSLTVSSDSSIGGSGHGHVRVIGGGFFETASLSLTGLQLSGGEGTLEVVGAGSRLRVNGAVTIGTNGLGELTLRDGALMQSSITTQSQQATIGSAATGIVTVEGDGTEWQHGGRMTIGGSGLGTLSIRDGAVVSSQGATVGQAATSFPASALGSVLVDGVGSRWNPSFLTIGDQGVGDVRISGGAMLISSVEAGPTLGVSSGSFGRLTISGLGTQWASSSTVTVGQTGSGELWIDEGAFVSSGTVNIAQTTTAVGRVVVRGDQTRWQVRSLAVGQSAGAATLEIAGGATVAYTGNASPSMNVGTQSRVILDGGTLSIGPAKTLNNSGWIQGSGQIVVGTFNQFANSRLTLGESDYLQISGNFSSQSQARVEIIGGELEVGGSFGSGFQNSIVIDHGAITLRGAAPLSNSGAISVIGLNNRIRGNVSNNNGTITVAGNSEATFYSNLTNVGTVKASAGSTLTVLGTFQGNGVTGPGTVFLEGPVQPGFSPGVMSFGGDLSLGDSSSLTIEVEGTTPGTGHDQLLVAGKLLLDGDLSFEVLTDLAAPTILTIANAADLVGVFDGIPALGEHLGFGARFSGIIYDYADDKVLVSLLPALAADFNRDGAIDGGDFLKWQQDLGMTSATLGAGADGDRDGEVDLDDLVLWRQALRSTLAHPSGIPVPEPATALQACIGLALLGATIRSRR